MTTALNEKKKALMEDISLERMNYYGRRYAMIKEFLNENISELSVIDIQFLRNEAQRCLEKSHGAAAMAKAAN